MWTLIIYEDEFFEFFRIFLHYVSFCGIMQLQCKSTREKGHDKKIKEQTVGKANYEKK